MSAPLAFITGASSGIGQALAARYATAGWRLALAARRVGEIEDWARSHGLGPERCIAYAADVQQIEAAVGEGVSHAPGAVGGDAGCKGLPGQDLGHG